MKKIFKYTLPVQTKISIFLPSGARILRVDDVEGRFYLWAIVDVDGEPEARHIECYKTGQEMPSDADALIYLGCCKLFIMQELCLYMFERVS